MLKIVLKNGDIAEWKEEQFTDYKYDGRSFVVINCGQWVGIYNFDCIMYVVVEK